MCRAFYSHFQVGSDNSKSRRGDPAKHTISVLSNVVSYRFIGEYFLILNNLTIIHRYIMKSNGFKKIFAYSSTCSH